jgi:phosphatidylglycerol---prolipoprotein diacylglyceryl transferase
MIAFLLIDFPVYIELGSSRLLLHNLAELLAFFAGFKYFQFLRRKQGDSLSAVNRSWVFAGAIFGALIGSRLLGGLENPLKMKESENLFIYFYENKTVVGGFLGGLFGVEAVKKIIREKRSSGDLFVKPILLALIIGRMGCFSMGIHEETYGLQTTLPWGINLGDGIQRHPVTFYEIIFLILLWVAISKLERKKFLRKGALFKFFMIAYLLFRFLLDFIKPHYNIIVGLSTIQLACLAGLFYYRRDIFFIGRLFSKPNTANA